jgi:hypothetical protein
LSTVYRYDVADGKVSISVVAEGAEVDAVIALSKLHQGTLGPLPFTAFHDAAKRGWILGAWAGAEIAGYLLFRPRKRDGVISITHLCIAKCTRGGASATPAANVNGP